MAALSPSDLSAAHVAERLRVAGRVSAADGDECQLADAMASVRVALRDAAPLVRRRARDRRKGRYDGRPLLEASLIERAHYAQPRGDGEWARLAWRGVAANMQARARAQSALRSYFARERFLEVETPLRVAGTQASTCIWTRSRRSGGFLITLARSCT